LEGIEMTISAPVKRLFILILIILSIDALIVHSPSSAAGKRLLILHSYHQGSRWTDSVMQGITEVLNEKGMDLEIYVEYMDTDRYPPEISFPYIEELYRRKYGQIAFDAILVTDNNALEFSLSRRDSLFQKAPIVFCGINDFNVSDLHGQTDVTGINEDVDIKGTIELALEIKPDIKKILVINDRSTTGLVNRKRYERDLSYLKDRLISFELYDDFTVTDLQARLRSLSSDAAVLVLSFRQDKTGRNFTPERYLSFVIDSCHVPVFSLWGADLGEGVLGGVVISGAAQGKNAAEYALRVLKGEPASSIPVLMKSPNVPMIDYRVLRQFNLHKRAMPQRVSLLFKPESVFMKYRNVILMSGILFGVLAVIVIVLSINAIIRRRTEKALSESEEKLSNALEIAYLGHWEYDVLKDIFIFNDHFYNIFHITADEAGGYAMSFDEYVRRFVHPDDVKMFREEMGRAVDAADPHYSRRLEHRIRYEDGGTGHIAVRFFIVKDKQCLTIMVYGVSQDITDQVQAEENLRRSETLYRMILQTAMDGFCLVDVKGRLLEVNEAYCSMLGYSREELLQMGIDDLEVEEMHSDISAHIEKISTQGGDIFETRHRRKDGGILDLEVSVQYRPTEGGLLSIFLHDITQKKLIEARLRQAEKLEAIGTLAGGIAHDFNNILQPLLGFSELLKADLPADSPSQRDVDRILISALRAKDLVNQILAFSRQDEKKLKPVKIQNVAKEAMKLLTASIPKSIDIEVDLDPDCGIVMADPTQIYQIVMNLCTNAYHAMENKGGRLKLILEQICLGPEDTGFLQLMPGEYARLKVADTGIGIERNIMDKIFDPYFTTKEKNKGTGLGLSVVQGIVKSSKGDIRIYSEPGKGTEVHVYLPVIEEMAGDRRKDEDEIIRGGAERILLVDDEVMIVQMMQQMLERLGYHVTAMTESVSALEEFNADAGNFDLVITDMTMPKMTGLQLAEMIKGIRKDIPVILCTGFSEQVCDEKLERLGIHGYIFKPVTIRQMAGTIRNALKKR